MENLSKEVIMAFIGGDEKSFGQIFNTYSRNIWLYFYQNTRSRETTEELVNNTFVRLWQYRNNIDAEQGVKKYLHKIARSIFYNWLTQVSRDTKMKQEYASSYQEAVEDKSGQLNANIDFKTLLNEVEILLPEKRRKVFLMSRISELSYAEIANQLSIGKETVKDHISKASQTLAALNKSEEYI